MRRAFTLVELIALAAILSTLAGLLLPVLGQAHRVARKARCAAQLHAIGAAVHRYAADHDALHTTRRLDGRRWPVDDTAPGSGPFWGTVHVPWLDAPDHETWRCPEVPERSAHARSSFAFNGLMGPAIAPDGTRAVAMAFFEPGPRHGAPPRRLTAIPRPARVVMVHDGAEPMLDGDGDTLHDACDEAADAIHRHAGACNVLWADASLREVRRAPSGSSIAWYTGLTGGIAPAIPNTP